jgi:hypothetical protein
VARRGGSGLSRPGSPACRHGSWVSRRGSGEAPPGSGLCGGASGVACRAAVVSGAASGRDRDASGAARIHMKDARSASGEARPGSGESLARESLRNVVESPLRAVESLLAGGLSPSTEGQKEAKADGTRARHRQSEWIAPGSRSTRGKPDRCQRDPGRPATERSHPRKEAGRMGRDVVRQTRKLHLMRNEVAVRRHHIDGQQRQPIERPDRSCGRFVTSNDRSGSSGERAKRSPDTGVQPSEVQRGAGGWRASTVRRPGPFIVPGKASIVRAVEIVGSSIHNRGVGQGHGVRGHCHPTASNRQPPT